MRQLTRNSAAWMLLAACLSARGAAQTAVDLRTQAKSVDFSQSAFTRPVKTGSILPATCATGDMFFDLSASPGTNLHGCVAANTWTVLSGGGGVPSPGGPHTILGVTAAGGAVEYKTLGSGLSGQGSTVLVDDAVVPAYLTGSGVPLMSCAAGRDFYTDSASGQLYHCSAANIWQADSRAFTAGTGLTISDPGPGNPLRVAAKAAYNMGAPLPGDTLTGASGTFASFYSIPANTLQPGRILDVTAYGAVSFPFVSNAPVFVLRLCTDPGCATSPVTLLTSPALTVPGGGVNFGWSLQATLVVTAATAIEAQGIFHIRVTSNGQSLAGAMANTAPFTFNPAVPLYLRISETAAIGANDVLRLRQFVARISE